VAAWRGVRSPRGAWRASSRSSLAPSRSRRAAAPNIVFIPADDLGPGDLGSYGQRKIETPSLDALAARDALHAALRGQRRLRALARGAADGTASRTRRDPRQPRASAGRAVAAAGSGADDRRGPEAARLRDRRDGQVGPRAAGVGGRPAEAGLRPLLRLQLPAPAHGYNPTYLYDDGRRVGLGNPESSPHQKLAAGADPLRPRELRRLSGNVYAPDVIWARGRDFIRCERARPFFVFLCRRRCRTSRCRCPEDSPRRVPRPASPRRRTSATRSTCRTDAAGGLTPRW
jgi:arylsulfatase